MRDFATSESAAVQAQLDRIPSVPRTEGRLSLDQIRCLLERIGNPHLQMPPVFHVAGTNGKGSTCTFLRHILEEQGLRVHSATKPHLVRYNERFRVGGRLVDDALLAEVLKDVIDRSGDMSPSFFEVTTAATFALFAHVPADVCIIEVGLGGRLDATNVIERPLVCGIASLGIDHEAFLLTPEEGLPSDPLARIAFEKASIAKPGVPLVCQSYPQHARQVVMRVAREVGAKLVMRGETWDAVGEEDGFAYTDSVGRISLPLPSLPGTHQIANAALAVAMIRHQDRIKVAADALVRGLQNASWPARLQRLGEGPLTDGAGARSIWLDGGHNPDAGAVLANFFEGGPPIHLVIGMLRSKAPRSIIGPLGPHLRSITVVPVPDHDSHQAEAFAPGDGLDLRSSPSVTDALRALPPQGDVLISGSLYLAGEVLRLNDESPE